MGSLGGNKEELSGGPEIGRSDLILNIVVNGLLAWVAPEELLGDCPKCLDIIFDGKDSAGADSCHLSEGTGG